MHLVRSGEGDGAALVAAQLGAQVTVIERDGIGGASVLTDCVPSKTLIAAAGAMTSVHDSAVLGVHGAGPAAVVAAASSSAGTAPLVDATVDAAAGAPGRPE